MAGPWSSWSQHRSPLGSSGLKFLILNRLFRSLPVDGETGSPSAADGSDHGTVTVQDGGGAKGGTVALNVQLAEGLPE